MTGHECSTKFDMSNVGRQTPTRTCSSFTLKQTKLLTRVTRGDATQGSTCRTLSNIRGGLSAARTRHLSPPPTEIRDAIAEKPPTWPARDEEDA